MTFQRSWVASQYICRTCLYGNCTAWHYWAE